MDFELSDDQQALRDAARALLDDRAAPGQVRKTMEGEDAYDPELWAAMIEQGWPGIAVTEDKGGVGLGVVELAVLLEQTGAHTAPVPFLQTALAVDAMATMDADPAWLEPLLSGSALCAVAFSPVRVTSPGPGWRLSGRTEPVLFAPSAGGLVVRGIADDGEEHLFGVDLRERPVAREPAMDRTREVGWVELDDTPAVHFSGGDAVSRFCDLGALGHAAEMLGAADRVLAMAVEYAKERVQFGRPIGSFQAVKHRCADMLVDVEGMRSAVYYAAWCLAAGDPDRSIAASMAKSWCSDAGLRVMSSGLQVHGGIGFTWEHDLHLFLKRAQLDSVSFGDAAHHRARLAGLVRAKLEAGGSVI